MNKLSVQQQTQAQAAHEKSLAAIAGDDISALVSPPDFYFKITNLIGDDRASMTELAELIMRDPSLTAKILRLVNSSYYSLPSKIDTVSRALAVIGMHELTSLVYSLCAVQSFSKVSCELTNMNTFWRHGVYCGLTAKAVAKKSNCLNTERLFVAGLLHDIGTLVFNAKFPEVAARCIGLAKGNENRLVELELEQVGFSHAELGAHMLTQWQLPEAICDAIRYHHNPQAATVTPLEAGILYTADTLANYSGTGSFSEVVDEQDEIDESITALIDLPVELDHDAVLEEVDRQFVETIYLLVA